jgi:uncharacterized protein YjbI with pentapeptide repeats
MKKTKLGADICPPPDEPDLPTDLPLLENATALFRNREVELHECLIENLNLVAVATSLRLETCVLKAVKLTNGNLPNLRMRDVRLDGCDLANVDARGLNAVRVEFLNCRMTGLRAAEADFQNVRMLRGDQRYCQFRFGAFKSAWFESANFEEADFQGTDLRGARFLNCHLRSAEMSRVTLVGADLCGSHVEGLRLSAPDIFGATVDAPQAMVFAALLGIRIRRSAVAPKSPKLLEERGPHPATAELA